ncbi:hypothetical protein ElyMa_001984600 [Elysia marginata]|uniref:Uncharacterized protein n=1 Tax=Elysia marginata TaxID=1093978 RepID=A0AAV4F2C5_9GAST|nr:hypothetical protein ElyMa_001984600 [Elysia marginata]
MRKILHFECHQQKYEKLYVKEEEEEKKKKRKNNTNKRRKKKQEEEKQQTKRQVVIRGGKRGEIRRSRRTKTIDEEIQDGWSGSQPSAAKPTLPMGVITSCGITVRAQM